MLPLTRAHVFYLSPLQGENTGVLLKKNVLLYLGKLGPVSPHNVDERITPSLENNPPLQKNSPVEAPRAPHTTQTAQKGTVHSLLFNLANGNLLRKYFLFERRHFIFISLLCQLVGSLC